MNDTHDPNRNHPSYGYPFGSSLRALLEHLPKGISPSDVSRRAMRLLMHKQYQGRPVPDCESLRRLMA